MKLEEHNISKADTSLLNLVEISQQNQKLFEGRTEKKWASSTIMQALFP